MKSTTRYFLILLALAAMILAGCSEDYGPAVGDGSFATLRTYLIDNDLDLPDILSSWTILADDLDGNTASYYIMDIRPDDVYDDGHIAGAVNVEMADVITEAGQAGGKTIVVVCKTGQEAGHAVMGLRLSGYADAKVLKWGMSGWNGDFDLWTPNTGDIAVGHENWVDGPAPAAQMHAYPALVTTATDGAGILAERVAAMLAGGFKGVLSSDVLATPGDYFINNFWAAEDVTTYGIFDGAYRIKPLDLEGNEFMHYDPDETVVTYCWSGQESSMVTAYLTVLGYDAKSMKYGVNSLIYSQLTKSKWGGPGDYDYVTTVPALAAQ